MVDSYDTVPSGQSSWHMDALAGEQTLTLIDTSDPPAASWTGTLGEQQASTTVFHDLDQDGVVEALHVVDSGGGMGFRVVNMAPAWAPWTRSGREAEAARSLRSTWRQATRAQRSS